jgi:uncharacterized protein YjbI with pentapeptide repeats
MDAEILKVVGQVAGIGGVALGVLLLVFRDVIRKKIFPMLTKEQAYKLLRLVLVLVWLVALVGIGAWVWVSTQTGNGNARAAFMALEIHDRTSRLRDVLTGGSEVPSPPASCQGEQLARSPEPSAFAVQQVVSLAQIDKKSVVEALVPLLGDQNSHISSGALLSLARVLETAGTERGKLVALLPRAEALASPGGQRLNLRGASLIDQNLTTFAGTDVFYGAEARAADLSGSRLDGITFKTANLSCASFAQASITGATFDMANLENAVFWGASAARATFLLTRLQGTDFSTHETVDPPSDLPFQTSTKHPPTNLEGADFGDAQMYSTNMSEARIGEARFHGASLSRVDFRGAFLMGMSPGVSEAYIRGLGPAVLDGCIFQ